MLAADISSFILFYEIVFTIMRLAPMFAFEAPLGDPRHTGREVPAWPFTELQIIALALFEPEI
jgi:hypothetical protein